MNAIPITGSLQQPRQFSTVPLLFPSAASPCIKAELNLCYQSSFQSSWHSEAYVGCSARSQVQQARCCNKNHETVPLSTRLE
jgi:hypothetical protein